MHLGAWAPRLWVCGLGAGAGRERDTEAGLGPGPRRGRGARGQGHGWGVRACAVPGAAGGAGARAAPRRHYTIARAARAGGGRRRRRDAGPRSCRSGTKRGRPAPPEPPEPGRSPRPPRLTDMMFPQSRHSVRGTPRAAPRSSPCTPSSAYCTPVARIPPVSPPRACPRGFLRAPSSQRPVSQSWGVCPQGPCTPTVQAVRTPPAQHCILQPGSLNLNPGPETPYPLSIPTPGSRSPPPPGSGPVCPPAQGPAPHSSRIRPVSQPWGTGPAAPQAQAAHVLQPETLHAQLWALHPPGPAR